jgi:hypothetical protein
MEMLERDHDFKFSRVGLCVSLKNLVFGSMGFLDLVSINEKNNQNSLEACEL